MAPICPIRRGGTRRSPAPLRAVVVGYLKDFGNAEIADPIMKIVFEKIGSDTEDDMTTVLNRPA
jgi:hypothetical protein